MADQHQHPAFALPAAGWGRRATALLLDGLFQILLACLVGLVVFLVVGDKVDVDTTVNDDGTVTREEYEYWLLGGVIAMFVIFFTYPWVLLGLMKGRTPGRRAVGIRVVTYAGTPVTLGRAFLRDGLVKGFMGLIGFALLLSYLWPLWDPHQRALHDLLCSTRVVEDHGDDGGAPVDAFGGPASPAATTTAPAPPTGRDDGLAGRIGLDG